MLVADLLTVFRYRSPSEEVSHEPKGGKMLLTAFLALWISSDILLFDSKPTRKDQKMKS